MLFRILWDNFRDFSLNCNISKKFETILKLLIEFKWAVTWYRIDSQFIWADFSLDRNSKNRFSINTFYLTVRNLVVGMFKWDVKNWAILQTKVQYPLVQDVRSNFWVNAVICDLIEDTFLHTPQIQSWMRGNNVMSLHVVLESFEKKYRILVFEMPELLLSFPFYFFVHCAILSNYKNKSQLF